MKIKASHITNLTDARYFAAKEVEWLGYNLDPASPHYIAPMTMQAIREWVGGVRTLGEFGFLSGEDLLNAVADHQLDAVQVGQFTPEADLEPLLGRVQVLREIVVEPDADAYALLEDIRRMAHLVEATIISFRPNRITWEDLKSGAPFDAAMLKTLGHAAPVLIDMDWSTAILPGFLKAVQPYGIVLCGGVEEKTGFKSFEELDEIFEVLETPV